MPVNDNLRDHNRIWHPRLAAMLLCASFATSAEAQVSEVQYRRAQPYIVELPPPEARGCYYHRGRRYCGTYCYWEVNGKRYCQRRERNAHSQAPFVEDADPGMVLK
jgi:hypothetical protein